MTGSTPLPDVIRATWPPERVRTIGPFDVSFASGGGNRVTAARLGDTGSCGAAVAAHEIEAVARAQRDAGQSPLFMVFGGQSALDGKLCDAGYSPRDATDILTGRCDRIALAPPPVTCFEVWPPLAVQEEIWQSGGIGPERLAVMARADAPKTTLFGRIADRPAGTAFVAVHGDTAMFHALEVAAPARRKGLARIMVRAAAHWALGRGAACFAVLVTRENAAARGLYASLGLEAVEQYRYRAK